MNTARLRELAEKAIVEQNSIRFGSNANIAFKDACSPDQILKLLDVVEAARELEQHNTGMFDSECPACNKFLEALAALDQPEKDA